MCARTWNFFRSPSVRTGQGQGSLFVPSPFRHEKDRVQLSFRFRSDMKRTGFGFRSTSVRTGCEQGSPFVPLPVRTEAERRSFPLKCSTERRPERKPNPVNIHFRKHRRYGLPLTSSSILATSHTTSSPIKNQQSCNNQLTTRSSSSSFLTFNTSTNCGHSNPSLSLSVFMANSITSIVSSTSVQRNSLSAVYLTS